MAKKKKEKKDSAPKTTGFEQSSDKITDKISPEGLRDVLSHLVTEGSEKFMEKVGAAYGIDPSLMVNPALQKLRSQLEQAKDIDPKTLQAQKEVIEKLDPEVAQALVAGRIEFGGEISEAAIIHQYAWKCYEDGDLDKAVSYGKKAVDLNPKSPSSRFNLGLFLINSGEFPESVAEFAAGLERRGELSDWYLSEAIRVLEVETYEKEEIVELLYALAMHYAANDQPEAAIDAYLDFIDESENEEWREKARAGVARLREEWNIE